MAYPTHRALNVVRVSAYLADVCTASSAFASAPSRGKIIKMGSVRYAAVTSADNAITSKIAGTAITGGSWTQANSSSAAGDVDTATPTAANFVNEDQNIEFITDGSGSSTVPCMFWADILVS